MVHSTVEYTIPCQLKRRIVFKLLRITGYPVKDYWIYVTEFRKTNRSARKSIIAYAR